MRSAYKHPDEPDLLPSPDALVLAPATVNTINKWAAGLAEDLFADATRVVTVRAELSRLRRGLGGTLLAQPYRIAPGVTARLVLPDDRSTLLPGSSAPVVLRLRAP